jgi:hypothetical protein
MMRKLRSVLQASEAERPDYSGRTLEGPLPVNALKRID